MQFYSMYSGFKEQNCMVHYLVMQQTNRFLLTAVASYVCFEAMAVRKCPLLYYLLRK